MSNQRGGRRGGSSLVARGCAGLGCLIGIFGFLIGMGAAGLAIFAPNALSGLMAGLTGISMQETRAITGDASHFDPYKALAEVRAFAGKDAKLLSIKAYYVRADGTMDLTAKYTPAPNTEYKFALEVPRPTNAPPVGAGGTTSGPWYQPITIDAYEPGHRSHISVSNGGTKLDYDFVNDGYTRETHNPTTDLSDPIVADPTCDLATLWKTATQKKDAPADAVAIIEYTAKGYTFNISGASIYLKFDSTCTLTGF